MHERCELFELLGGRPPEREHAVHGSGLHISEQVATDFSVAPPAACVAPARFGLLSSLRKMSSPSHPPSAAR